MKTPFVSLVFDRIVERAKLEGSEESMQFVNAMKNLMENYTMIKETIGNSSLVFHSTTFRQSMQKNLNYMKSDAFKLIQGEAKYNDPRILDQTNLNF